jgi:undecaprenyl diphosphate synthase
LSNVTNPPIYDVNHLAVIMDGNGRWAKDKGLPRKEGHRRGVEALRKTIKACAEFGIKELTVYAFSSENWRRPKEEVDFLMSLFDILIKKEVKKLHEQNVKVNFVGDMTKLSKSLQKKIADAQELTKNNSLLTVNVCMNYGSREEITNAVRCIADEVVSGKLISEEITQQTITDHLYNPAMTEPDLLIRTSGEYRISNFLLWQIAYSEIWITQKLWPEFDRDLLKEALESFKNRERKFGGLIS